jgi:hypothetical protein
MENKNTYPGQSAEIRKSPPALESNRSLPCDKKRHIAVDRSDRIGEIEGLIHLDPGNHEEPAIRIKGNIQSEAEMRQNHRFKIGLRIRRRFQQIGSPDVDEEVIVQVGPKFRQPHDLLIGESIPYPLGQTEGEVLTEIHLDSRFQRSVPRKKAGTSGNPDVKRRSSCRNRLKTHCQEDKQDNQFSHNPLSPIPCSTLFHTRTQYINEREACKTF